MKLFSLFAAIFAFITILAASSADAYSCTNPCDAATCQNPICGFNAPFRCTVSDASVPSCTNNQSILSPDMCTSCCDVTACATPTCSGTCPQSVCVQNNCQSPSPFMCTQGLAQNGCAPAASDWINNTVCGSCCDAASCSSNNPTPPPPPSPTNNTPAPTSPVPPPPSPPSFNCNHNCNAFCSSPNRCSISNPYMCTAGPSQYGCSNNASIWPTSGGFCTACCDVATSCTVTCTVCPASQCIAPICTSMAKYLCTKGVADGQCAPTADFWSQNPGCSSCCYCPS